MKGPTGIPTVTIKVQIPMYRARCSRKKVSATTPLPMAAAGLMNQADSTLHAIMAP